MNKYNCERRTLAQPVSIRNWTVSPEAGAVHLNAKSVPSNFVVISSSLKSGKKEFDTLLVCL